jgi:eukaryotic-like serine/threonine-protein kinase
LIGELVGGRYRVVRHIAAGGMGSVCEAVHDVTGRRVALKIIRIKSDDAEDRETWLARFAREARSAGALDSPHIAQVFDASTDQATGQHYIAMELLSGTDLGQLLRDKGALGLQAALRIVGQACAGLAAAHRAGIVHRDIKPGNLFLAQQQGEIVVKLVDFGVAKFDEDTQPETARELTRTGAILGTPNYMSPEQAMGLKAVDARTDLWSLGVVLYRVLCGTLPHPNVEGTGQLIIAICTEPAPSVQRAAPWVPPEIAAIVRRALKIDKGERYQTAEEMLAAIREVAGEDLTLTEEMLEAVPEEQRSHVAERYSDRPTIAATSAPASTTLRSEQPREESGTHTGMSRGQTAPPRAPEARRTRTRKLGLIALITAVPLALAAYVLSSFGSGTTEPGSTASASALAARPDPPSAPPASAPDPGGNLLTVRLVVEPASAEVTVDGEPRQVEGDGVSIRGRLGSVHEVVAKADGRETRARVVITEAGALPKEIRVAAEPRAQRPPAGRPSRPAASSPPAPQPPPAKPEPRPPAGLRPTDSFE